MKSISTINPAITENTKCSIVEVYASFVDLRWVSRLIMLYYYSPFRLYVALLKC